MYEVMRIDVEKNRMYSIAKGRITIEELEHYLEEMSAKSFKLKEGFGLVALESIACGTPVVAAKTTSVPEILGQAGLYFDPKDINDMAKKIKLLFDDKELYKKLQNQGLEQAKKYSWQECAKETFKIYQSI